MHYLYLALGCGLVAIVILVALVRPDLRPAIIGAGLVGGLLESLAEVWYLRDYWHPLTVFGFPAPEDFIYGFGVTGLTVCVAPVLMWAKYQPSRQHSRNLGRLATLLSVFSLAMIALQIWTPINSIWGACICFAAIGLILLPYRPDVILPAVLGGLGMGLVGLVSYGVGLNYFIDGQAFLNHVCLHHGQTCGTRFWGQIPLDEVIWNLARGFCIAAAYPLVTGQTLHELRPPSRYSPFH